MAETLSNTTQATLTVNEFPQSNAIELVTFDHFGWSNLKFISIKNETYTGNRGNCNFNQSGELG